jgi:hypothetical protein
VLNAESHTHAYLHLPADIRHVVIPKTLKPHFEPRRTIASEEHKTQFLEFLRRERTKEVELLAIEAAAAAAALALESSATSNQSQSFSANSHATPMALKKEQSKKTPHAPLGRRPDFASGKSFKGTESTSFKAPNNPPTPPVAPVEAPKLVAPPLEVTLIGSWETQEHADKYFREKRHYNRLVYIPGLFSFLKNKHVTFFLFVKLHKC